MSSFKSRNLFGSGPHRARFGPQGPLTIPNTAMGSFDSGSTPIGMRELEITIEGRLAASSESSLRALRDAVVDELAHPPEPGTLVDTRGRTWPGMSFITYEEGDRVDRGREASIAYRAVFRRLNSLG